MKITENKLEIIIINKLEHLFNIFNNKIQDLKKFNKKNN